jgi:hypothetical protein
MRKLVAVMHPLFKGSETYNPKLYIKATGTGVKIF